jgi:hypothetical protein
LKGVGWYNCPTPYIYEGRKEMANTKRFIVGMKDGTTHNAPQIVGGQMLGYGVGEITLLLENGRKRRRLPVRDIAFIEEVVDEQIATKETAHSDEGLPG